MYISFSMKKIHEITWSHKTQMIYVYHEDGKENFAYLEEAQNLGC